MPSFTSFPRDIDKWGPSSWVKREKEQEETWGQKKTRTIQPRFSVFGNHGKLRLMNEDWQKKTDCCSSPSSRKPKKVHFDPLCLEHILLFHASQSPVELKQPNSVLDAHDADSELSHWPSLSSPPIIQQTSCICQVR
ncbi:hypothetical protein BY458DRAFT_521023 [Sporodiniella umbellata]|nr:hypothetical protein BY458DRAFT_521023 [Sporodiniella umbellata]